MPTVLISGANRGIGLEFLRQYRADGWRVIGTVRNSAQASTLVQLGCEAQILDVREIASIEHLGRALQHDSIDLFIANAGIYEGPLLPLSETTETLWVDTFRVNTIGPLLLAQALLGPVRRSEQRKMVALTSMLASISLNNRPGHYPYRTSKAALNAGWHAMSIDQSDITCALLNPGWVKTDMGGAHAPLSAKESVSGMRKVISGLTRADSGKWYDYQGIQMSW